MADSADYPDDDEYINPEDYFGNYSYSDFNDTSVHDNVTFRHECNNVQWGDRMHFFALYVITALGVASNLVALMVLTLSRRTRRSPCGVFLISLALADSLVLITELMAVLASQGCHTNRLQPLMRDTGCRILSYAKYWTRGVASYIVVLISVNRFLSVAYPLKSRQLATVTSSAIQVGVCGAVLAVCYVYSPFLMISTNRGCQVAKHLQHAYFVATVVIDVILCDVTTSVSVLVFSLATIHMVVRSRSQIKRKMSTPDGRRKEEEHQLTVMLLTVSLTFSALRIPYVIAWIIHTLVRSPHSLNAFYLLYSVSLLNYSINLYLYCVCSGSFRAECRRMCTCVFRCKGLRAFRRSSTSSSGKDRRGSQPSSGASTHRGSTSTGTLVTTSGPACPSTEC